MTTNERVIPNSEVVPRVETDLFSNDNMQNRYAIVSLGTGTQDSDLFRGYLRLRANVYVHQRGILSPDEIRPDGTEMDEDDERSSHFAVVENRIGSAAVVACIRLIEKSLTDSRPLPIEHEFPAAFSGADPEPRSVEVSRFISRLDNGRDQFGAITELFKSGLARIEQQGLGPVYGIVEEPLERSLKAMETYPTRLSDPNYIPKYNSSNVGIKLDTDAMTSKIYGRSVIAATDVSPGAVRYWGSHDSPTYTRID